MKKQKFKKTLILSMLCIGSFVATAQNQNVNNLEKTEVTNGVEYQTIIDGVEISYSTSRVSNVVTVLNVEFMNTLNSKMTFTWKVINSNGISSQENELTLAPGEKVILNNIMEMKGSIDFSNYIMSLIIK